MNYFTEVADTVATVQAATAGSRRISVEEVAKLERDVRNAAVAAGVDPARAALMADSLATATAAFGAACVSANAAAKQMTSALAEVRELAREIDKREGTK